MAEWNWILCNGAGQAVADLTRAGGKQVKYARNTFSEAQFTLSHEDVEAAALMEVLAAGPLPTLRCYRRPAGAPTGVLRFNGHLAPFTESSEESSLITAVFRSPFGRLLGEGSSGMGRFTGASILASEQEQTAIAKALILLYGGGGTIGETDPTFTVKYAEKFFAGLGIGVIGEAATPQKRTVNYRHANVGQAIINLSACLNGFDFDEEFVERGETLALFNTYASQGESKPAAKFEYGPGTLANLAKIDRSTFQPINWIRLLGANGLVVEKENLASIEQYGKWSYVQQVSDATSKPLLEARAEALLRTKPFRTISLYPDFQVASCPEPFDDFFLGDTVPVYARRGALEESASTRVNELTLVIDEDGNETSAIPDPHAAAGNAASAPDSLHSTFKVEG